MTIEIVDFPIETGGSSYSCVSLPEGYPIIYDGLKNMFQPAKVVQDIATIHRLLEGTWCKMDDVTNVTIVGIFGCRTNGRLVSIMF